MSEQGDVPVSAPALPLWHRIEEIRLRRGWSRTQLAHEIGMSRNTIDNWKKQANPPQAGTIRDVAEKLGIPHDEALRLAGWPAPPSGISPTSERLDQFEAQTKAIAEELKLRMAIADAAQRQAAHRAGNAAAESAQLEVLRALQGDLPPEDHN